MMTNRSLFHFNDVKKDTLLLVEGIEDAMFFSAIVHHLGRTPIQIAYAGSKDKIRPFLISTLSNSDNFSRLRRLGIVRDADNSATSTLQSLRGALADANLPAPRRPWEVAHEGKLRVSLAILPDGSSKGNLEDMCFRSIGNSPESTCVDQYVGCRVSAGAQIADNRIAKSKVYAYLAVGKNSAKPGLRLGEAAEAGVWDWEAPEFGKIVDFLKNL